MVPGRNTNRFQDENDHERPQSVLEKDSQPGVWGGMKRKSPKTGL